MAVLMWPQAWAAPRLLAPCLSTIAVCIRLAVTSARAGFKRSRECRFVRGCSVSTFVAKDSQAPSLLRHRLEARRQGYLA